MTLDEIEKLARVALQEGAESWETDQLARALLLVLPVVRAAERLLPAPPPRTQYLDMDRTDWCCVDCAPDGDIVQARRERGESDFYCAPHALIRAFSTLHATTTQKAGSK